MSFINGTTPASEWDVGAWVNSRIEAARKNLPAATPFQILPGMNEANVRAALSAAGVQYYFGGHMGNRVVTITGLTNPQRSVE